MKCNYCGKEETTKKITIMRKELNICPNCESIRGRVNKGVEKKKGKFKVTIGKREFEVL